MEVMKSTPIHQDLSSLKTLRRKLVSLIKLTTQFDTLISNLCKLPSNTQSFLIFGIPRSGTTLLCHYLDSKPHLVHFFEFLNVNNFAHFGRTPRYIQFILFGCLFPKTRARRLAQRHHDKEVTHFGYKIVTNQHSAYLLSMLAETKIKKIFLTRENLLRRYLSNVLAIETGLWKIKKHSGVRRPSRKIYIDPVALIANIKYFKREIARIRQVTNNYVLEITYEELTTNKTQTLRKVAEHLSIPYDRLNFSPQISKVNEGDLQDLIENYEEVHAALNNTEFEEYLHTN